ESVRELVGDDRVRLEDLQLEAAGEEAALVEGAVPVHVAVEGRVDAEPEGDGAAPRRVPGQINRRRELDDVARLVPSRRATVGVGGVLEVEPGLELQAAQARDGRRVVVHRGGVGGAGGEGSRLTGGAAAMLEEVEAAGGGEPRQEEQQGEDDYRGEAGVAHGPSSRAR